jgi:hypothetical protein
MSVQPLDCEIEMSRTCDAQSMHAVGCPGFRRQNDIPKIERED